MFVDKNTKFWILDVGSNSGNRLNKKNHPASKKSFRSFGSGPN